MSETLGVFRSRASDLFKLQTGVRTALGWTYRTSEILRYTVSRRWRCESSNLVIPCGVDSAVYTARPAYSAPGYLNIRRGKKTVAVIQ